MAPSSSPLDPAVLLEQARWVRALVRGLIRDEALAEDVVQETWVAALERRPAGDQAGGLRAWLAAVARNLALRSRRRALVRAAVERAGARPERIGSGTDEVERMQLQQRLASAVLALDEPHRSAVILRHLDGLSSAEIARRQGCTSEAARQRVARGLAMLRARLAGEFEDRGAWCAALVKLAGPSWSAGTLAGGLVPGGILMSTKIALGAALAALVAAALWTIESERGERGSEVAGEEVPAYALPEPALPPAEGTVRATRGDPAPLAAVRERGARHAVDVGQRPSNPLVLRGTVTDRTGNRLSGALLGYQVEGEVIEQPVAEDGSFALAPVHVLHLPLELDVSCPGFVTETVEARLDEPLVIVLKALPALAGRLLDPDGLPAAPPGRVRLEIVLAGTNARVNHDAPITEDGSFRVEGLPVGRLAGVWARAKGFAPQELVLGRALEPDRTETLDVVLSRGATVTGVVLDSETREPVPGAEVWVETFQPDDDELAPSTLADAQGRFRLEGAAEELQRVSDGTLALWFWLMGQAEGYVASPGRAYGTQPNGAHEYDFELLIEPADSELHARIWRPDGSPAGGAQVIGISSEGNLVWTTVDAEGRFELEDLPAGVLELWVEEGAACLRTDIELQAGVTRSEDLLLLSGDGRLTGRVVDLTGRPVSGLEVETQFLFRSSSLSMGVGSREVETDSGGRYAFEGLHPGQHSVQVRVQGTATPCAAPAFPWVDVAAGLETRVDVVVGPCLVIDGRVDTGGQSPAGLEVRAVDARGREGVSTARVTDDATFSFEPLLAREYELVLVRDEEELDRTTAGPLASAGLVLRAAGR